MRGKIVLLLLCFSFSLLAEKTPKWKPGAMMVDANGIRYTIKKQGAGDSVNPGDYATMKLVFYNPVSKKYDRELNKTGPAGKTDGKMVMKVNDAASFNHLDMAAMHLRVGGKGFFVLPHEFFAVKNPGDSVCCFIELLSIQRLNIGITPVDSANGKDSVNFVMPDPNADYYGDSIFTSARLIEAPKILSCGSYSVTQSFRFQLQWFDNGVQKKDILVYIHCPSNYGENYFVIGKTYIITAIPMTKKLMDAQNIVDQFPNENLERYYLLRIR